jgi:pimeloyl-ACP methyl ester carboxylesterase
MNYESLPKTSLRWTARPPREGIVLLHGIAKTARSMRPMQRALERAGYAVLNLTYPSRRRSIEDLAEIIRPDVERFASALDGATLHFVGHSMGGLLARVYIARYRPHGLGRVVMLGTPNGGSEVADTFKRFAVFRQLLGPAGLQLTTMERHAWKAELPPVDYPLGVIAGSRTVNPILSLIVARPNDGKVSIASTRLDGMADHVVVRKSHPFIAMGRVPIGHTLAFLREGRFAA